MKKYLIETPVGFNEEWLARLEADFAAALADPDKTIITLAPGVVVKEIDVDPQRFDVSALEE